jgi:hypothetical protein
MIHVAQAIQVKAFGDFLAPIVSKLDPASIIATAMVTNLSPTLIHHGDK